jgi:light-harvesting complex II chlorophyll a/b binding protein 4
MSFTAAKVSPVSNGAKVTMARKGTLTLKKAAPAKKGTKVGTKVAKGKGTKIGQKAAPRSAPGRGSAATERLLWLPNTVAPEWLDGSMVGDRGFDPLGLGKPVEYVQMDLDNLNQNAPINAMGREIGILTPDNATVSEDSLQPYNEVFDIMRFRECELIHGRWCMLAVTGALVAELATGVTWIDAGKVQLEGASYLGNEIPFSLSTLVAIEVVLMGYIEGARNGTLDLEKRQYPGGKFDPLGLADDPDRALQLKTAEIKHARLAMVAIFGFSVQAAFTDTTSPLENLSFLN